MKLDFKRQNNKMFYSHQANSWLSYKNGNHLKATEDFKHVRFWVRDTAYDTESSNALTWAVCNKIKRSGIPKFPE